MEIYQFWSNLDGKMGVSAGEMRVLVQFLDAFCGKIVVFDGETRILVQFWMENGCNLPTPPFGKFAKSIGKLQIFCGKLGSC